MSKEAPGTFEDKEFTPKIKLRLSDLRAGHYPDTKDPPWGLNDMFLFGHQEIEKRIESLGLKPGEEKFLMIAEMPADNGEDALICDLKVRSDGTEPGFFSLWAYPHAKADI